MEQFTPEVQQQIDEILAMVDRRAKTKQTGPKTPLGKLRSSQNARKHGLTARKSIVVDPKDVKEYRRYHKAMFQTLEPKNELQITLADIIVQSAWRLNFIAQIEADYMRANLENRFVDRLHSAYTFGGSSSHMDSLSRYRSATERSLHRALTRLADIQSKTTQKETQTAA